MSTSCIFLLILIITFTTILSQNTFQCDNETIWRSTSDFQIREATSYGTIKLGANMRMQFDLIWYGRTSTQHEWEQFFRVGFDAAISQSCDGQSSRYPSLWLKGDSDILHVSISDDTACNKKYDLPGIINIDQLYNIIIEYNQTQINIYKDNELVISSDRIGTQNKYIGDTLEIWIPSNKYSGSYISGNATLSNIILTTNIFTVEPTIDPTKSLLIHPTMIPSVYPTNNPIISPSKSTITTSFHRTSNPWYNSLSNPTSIPSLPPTTNPRVNSSFDPTTNSINDTMIEYIGTIPAVVITATIAYIITLTESKEDIQQQQAGNNVNGWDMELIALITIIIMFICCSLGIGLFLLVQRKLFKQIKETKLKTIKQIEDSNNVLERNRKRIATESYRSNSDKKSIDILDNHRNNDEEEEDPESNLIQSDLSNISELEKVLNINNNNNNNNNNDLDKDFDIFDGPIPSGMQMVMNDMINHEMAEGFAVDYDEKENESIISELEMVEYDDRNINEFQVENVNIVQMEGITKHINIDRKERKKKKKHYKKKHQKMYIKDENNVYYE